MKRLWMLVLFVVLVLSACGRQQATQTVPGEGSELSVQVATELFFSEYIEGSSLNKALEIYNGTGASVDLAAAGYNVQLFVNGSDTANSAIDLTGVLAAGDVFVLANSSAGSAITAEADQTTGAVSFNGNDAVVLRRGTTVIDSIGQVGVDPGTEWGSGTTSTSEHTLRRKDSVCAGDTNPNDPFDPSVEWNGFPQDTFDGLGSHTATCVGEDEPPVVPSIVINEVDYDQPSTDTAEFIELKNTGASSVNLAAFAIELVNGNNDSVYGTFGLPDVDLAPGGYWVLCANAATVANCDLDVSPDTNLIQNGSPDAVRLMMGATVVDAVSYEGSVPGAVEGSGDGLEDSGEGSISRTPDGIDTDQNNVDFAFVSTPTPGAENGVGSPPVPGIGSCDDPATLIHAVQGTGFSSPIEGATVSIEGVVVGDFQGSAALKGFYVQEELADQDGDPSTSEGIFVFDDSTPLVDVQVGDVVRVEGEVDEFFGLTQITAVTGVIVCASGPAPDPVELVFPLTDAEREQHEGMLVSLPQELVISEYFNFDRFGEIVLAWPLADLDRPFQPTSYAEPGSAEAADIAAAIIDRRITLDDGRSSQNPDPLIHPEGGVFDENNRFRGGDVVANATGILDYRFSLYRIQPTTGADHEIVNPRSAVPESVGGELTVATFNVLNYFVTIDLGPDICGPNQAQDCRGADNAEEFERQRTKIIEALAVIDADVVGLIEMENTTGVEPLADLVAGLNVELGAGTYAYIDTGVIGTDAIRQGFIYKPETVTPTGPYAVLDTVDFLDPNDTGSARNRPALAQTFTQNSDGALFTAVVNHLKSKGSSCGPGDDDPEQGNCNLTRTLAAQELHDWLATDPTGSNDSDFLILGDLNAYDEEDPIDVLKDGGYVDLGETFQGEFTYTFVFDGLFGHLDYAMANASMAGQATGATNWHINADEPDIFDYNTDFKSPSQIDFWEANPYRSSDHDPVIVGLDLNAPPVCTGAAPSTASLWPANHKLVAVQIEGVTDPDGDSVTIEVTSIYQDEPVNAIGNGDGNTSPDAAGVETSTAEVRAERAGRGNGRVYHIGFTAMDADGLSCSGEVQVSVPRDQRRGGAAVDDGALYESTQMP